MSDYGIRRGAVEDYLDPPDEGEDPEVRLADAPLSALVRALANHVGSLQPKDEVKDKAACAIRSLLYAYGYRFVDLTDEEWQAHQEALRDFHLTF